jgi:hypothetical protein
MTLSFTNDGRSYDATSRALLGSDGSREVSFFLTEEALQRSTSPVRS